MNNRPWTFTSYLFHPLFMPTIGAFIVMWNDPQIFLTLDSPKFWINLLGSVFVSTTLLPLLFCLTLKRMGKITSLQNPNDNDRKMLIMFSELGFLLAYLTFFHIPAFGHSLSIFLLGINIAMIATLLLSFVQRTSFHATGMGGIVGTTIGLMYSTRMNMDYWIGGAIAIACLVGVARYRLKAHNTFEIYLGYIVGILSLGLVFILGTKHV